MSIKVSPIPGAIHQTTNGWEQSYDPKWMWYEYVLWPETWETKNSKAKRINIMQVNTLREGRGMRTSCCPSDCPTESKKSLGGGGSGIFSMFIQWIDV